MTGLQEVMLKEKESKVNIIIDVEDDCGGITFIAVFSCKLKHLDGLFGIGEGPEEALAELDAEIKYLERKLQERREAEAKARSEELKKRAEDYAESYCTQYNVTDPKVQRAIYHSHLMHLANN